mmetsp:Transcript_139395/g.347573  ORF Transcript_139395/g.347573 Transcript_139395/m.347573 type:complete len:268 (-) Transcript_139395:1257-2060(-)
MPLHQLQAEPDEHDAARAEIGGRAEVGERLLPQGQKQPDLGVVRELPDVAENASHGHDQGYNLQTALHPDLRNHAALVFQAVLDAVEALEAECEADTATAGHDQPEEHDGQPAPCRCAGKSVNIDSNMLRAAGQVFLEIPLDLRLGLQDHDQHRGRSHTHAVPTHAHEAGQDPLLPLAPVYCCTILDEGKQVDGEHRLRDDPRDVEDCVQLDGGDVFLGQFAHLTYHRQCRGAICRGNAMESPGLTNGILLRIQVCREDIHKHEIRE